MSDLLSYLVIEDNDKTKNLIDEYKKINELRNRFAYGASSETHYSISFDEFEKIFTDVSSI